MPYSRIAWAAGGLDARDAIVDTGQRGKLRVRLGLIPVGHRIKIVGAVIGMAVLNRGAQRFREGDR